MPVLYSPENKRLRGWLYGQIYELARKSIFMQSYDTLTEALDGLRQQGYTQDYNLKSDSLYCQADSITLQPDDFDIVHVYRFEGMTDPDDEAVLYAIEARNGNKGTLVDAYGPYSEAVTPEMAEKLRYTPKN
jgi:hypothetical protein